MVFKSILSTSTNYSNTDTSIADNCDHNIDYSQATNSSFYETAQEKNSDLELAEVSDVTIHQNNDKFTSKSNNKKQLKSSRLKKISLSKENIAPTGTNETILSHSSKVWKYATRIPNTNFSTCCLCPDKKQISSNNGSTSTIRKHLISKHNIQELVLPTEERKTTKPFISGENNRKLHDLFINCIIKDSRTFNDLQKPGMKKLLQELVPGYEPPSRYSVVRRIKSLHIFYLKKLIDDLSSVNHLSITLDFWSNRKMKSFLVITGHYFRTNDFKLQSIVLNFSTFDKQHKAIEITRTVKSKLMELNILHKVVRITADGASNMVRAIEDMELNLKRVWCVAHRLHLIIINALGFWIVKKEHLKNSSTVNESETVVNESDNHEADMMDMDEVQNNNELDDTYMDLIDDTEIDVNEPVEDNLTGEDLSLDIIGEELQWDLVEEDITDNWTTDVVESDVSMVHDQDIILSLVKKCRGLILMIKRSTVITLFFDQERKKLNIKRNLCYDVKCRWNSTYSMVDSFLELREVIEKLFNYKHNLHIQPKQLIKLSSFEMTIDEWIMLAALRSVLKPFFNATNVLSGSQYPSIGIAYYLLMRLKGFLQYHEKKEAGMVKRLKQLLLVKFVHYFENDTEQINLLKFHAFFDPAGCAALNDSEKRSIEQDIKRIVIEDPYYANDLIPSTSSIAATTISSSNETNSKSNTSANAMDIFNESVGELSYEETQRGKNTKATIVDDIHHYRKCISQFNVKYKPDVKTSLLFWETYGKNFSILGKLAKTMLTTPATSVPSESCFSIASYIGRKERVRLTGENLSSSVFLKDKINF